MDNIDHPQKSKIETAPPQQQETVKESWAGDYIINPQGSDKFFNAINKDDFGRIESVEPNRDLSLSDITKIGGLDAYSGYSASWYQIERIIENSINKNELNDDLLIKILEWNDDVQHRPRGENYESYIIKPLAKNKMISEKIINWLMKNSRKDYSLIELADYRALSEEQIKNWVIKSKGSYSKHQLIEKGAISNKNFSPEEIEKLYFSGDLLDNWRAHLYYEIASKIMPGWNAEAARKFIKKAIDEIIDYYGGLNPANEPVRSGGFYTYSEDLKTRVASAETLDGKKELFYPEACADIVTDITRFPQYLSDEQIISLIKSCPPINHGYSDAMPGWAFKGLLLRYGPDPAYEKNAIRDFDKPEYKEKYALMEKMFSKESPIAEILTEKEQLEIMEEVKDCGYKLFKPIYPAGFEEKDVISFEHISGTPGLTYLVPTRSRNTDRFLHDYGVYLQKGGMETWQISHLGSINKGKLYNYYINLPKKLLEDYAVYKDDRWKGGYMTKRPIILDGNSELNWDMFNPLMKMEAFSHYERIFGPLPNEIKNRLMEGGTKTDADV